MHERAVIHIVDADSKVCAQTARAAFDLGHHAEVYTGLIELYELKPRRGIVLVRDDLPDNGFATLGQSFARSGIWLPIVAMDENPDIRRVVSAIKSGALDYLALPVSPQGLSDMLARIDAEAQDRSQAARALVEARNRIGTLSAREREVLDWLAQGSSNKAIARELHISPRTVEIHRANMMSKLGASHPAEVIRMQLAAQFDRMAG